MQWLISFSLDGEETENKEVTLSARVFGEDVKKLLCITPAFFMIPVIVGYMDNIYLSR